jgi:hypothetical protein
MLTYGQDGLSFDMGGYYEAEEKIFRRSNKVSKADSDILRSTIHKHCLGISHFLSAGLR